jgi:predicted nucleotidyltransferase
MHALVESHRAALIDLRRRYDVRRLELFGSAAGEDFDPATSDLGFLVEFAPCLPGERYQRCFDLLDELRTLFQRNIDLVKPRTMRNPYFIHRVNENHAPICAA